MKRIVPYICICFFLIHWGTYASSTPDSLLNLLKVQTKQDTVRAKLLNKISRHYYQEGDYTNSLNYAEQALKLSEALQFPQGFVFAYYNLGECYTQMNELEKAETILKKG